MSTSKIVPVTHHPLADTSFEVMGEQLTVQYRSATGGMREVVKFGAMMMFLETHLAAIDSTVESKGKGKGRYPKGSGVKAWLKRYAPKVNESTAYRFKNVAESVAEKYVSIVGTKTAKQLTLPALVMTRTEDLPKAVQAKQEQLFAFVDGTSQNSWLDKFKPTKRKGGNQGGGGGEKVDPGTASENIWDPIIRDLQLEGIDEKSWAQLPDAKLRKLKGLLIDLNKLVPAK